MPANLRSEGDLGGEWPKEGWQWRWAHSATICDNDPVVVGGEHRVLAGCPSEVEAVHPRVASEDHIGDVTERPCLRSTVDDLHPRQASAA
jgi:hypothetical protein